MHQSSIGISTGVTKSDIILNALTILRTTSGDKFNFFWIIFELSWVAVELLIFQISFSLTCSIYKLEFTADGKTFSYLCLSEWNLVKSKADTLWTWYHFRSILVVVLSQSEWEREKSVEDNYVENCSIPFSSFRCCFPIISRVGAIKERYQLENWLIFETKIAPVVNEKVSITVCTRGKSVTMNIGWTLDSSSCLPFLLLIGTHSTNAKINSHKRQS